jgi:hypothetical protein
MDDLSLHLGFRDICEGYALDLLLPDDLEHIVCGAPALQLADLQSVTLYEGFTPRDPVVVWFWETVLAFTHDQKEAFLVFVTGSARCPIGGLSQLHLKVRAALNSVKIRYLVLLISFSF